MVLQEIIWETAYATYYAAGCCSQSRLVSDSMPLAVSSDLVIVLKTALARLGGVDAAYCSLRAQL